MVLILDGSSECAVHLRTESDSLICSSFLHRQNNFLLEFNSVFLIYSFSVTPGYFDTEIITVHVALLKNTEVN